MELFFYCRCHSRGINREYGFGAGNAISPIEELGDDGIKIRWRMEDEVLLRSIIPEVSVGNMVLEQAM
jgi:hypothetical protein